MVEVIDTYVVIADGRVSRNGKTLFEFNINNGLNDGLKQLYKLFKIEYLKFFKMDALSKLGFLAGELVMQEAGLTEEEKSAMGIFLCNSTASLDTDMQHERSIRDRNHFVPSPSVFVYTLPNILMGELAIRHKIRGENTFLIFDKFEADFTRQYARLLLETYGLKQMLLGWVDLLDQDYRAFLTLISRSDSPGEKRLFSPENLMKAYQNQLD